MSLVAISGNASGTGTLTIAAPNTNSNRTLNLPDGSGTFTVNGVNSNIVSGTAVASTSGTSIDFTSIPSWVKRITVMFQGVSLSGSSDLLIQLGTGGVATTTGYLVTWGYVYTASSAGVNSATTSIIRAGSINASTTWSGIVTVNLLSGNSWVASSTLGSVSDKIITYSSGSITLGGVLNMVRITTSNGTDTFDAGSINILYE
ncbi:hypothetical protein UFOVP267_55 [uncultured Caudovirales phage]|uniref:Uncharacterized protein n=1 Tax=uncultured Caudovirales phage TaxID=2100421 RepID=A0A6J5LN33_9CAUD|nr:hypothetical protein UFOVP267_55 [uncultured Caudovirales phage]